eukprot:NODE_147_length_1340_cov_420.484749_g143_i0.p2 GENE.NODE_147_length_1340_cov_420.484749_g143_i0~~NODE_147_length_1340_cov_420.484749_g143_i0.p2  ORF type:complete len:69 (+),score=5.26 NODE_147_length_1340_cov_420.484749_g143_i0:125-331(+)
MRQTSTVLIDQLGDLGTEAQSGFLVHWSSMVTQSIKFDQKELYQSVSSYCPLELRCGTYHNTFVRSVA